MTRNTLTALSADLHWVQDWVYGFRVTTATDHDVRRPGQAPSRRELNKTRTRERLLEALREQLIKGDLDRMTVEAVAESAGVSRRTFFNYFPSLEDAIAEGVSAPIEGMTAAFAARPAHESPLDAFRAVLRETPVPRELLTWIAAARCAGRERHQLTVNFWGYHQQWLEHLLRDRFEDADELAVSSLAGTVMALFEAAERQWMRTVAGGPTAEIDDASEARFNALLLRALDHAAAGWATPVATTRSTHPSD